MFLFYDGKITRMNHSHFNVVERILYLCCARALLKNIYKNIYLLCFYFTFLQPPNCMLEFLKFWSKICIPYQLISLGSIPNFLSILFLSIFWLVEIWITNIFCWLKIEGSFDPNYLDTFSWNIFCIVCIFCILISEKKFFEDSLKIKEYKN